MRSFFRFCLDKNQECDGLSYGISSVLKPYCRTYIKHRMVSMLLYGPHILCRPLLIASATYPRRLFPIYRISLDVITLSLSPNTALNMDACRIENDTSRLRTYCWPSVRTKCIPEYAAWRPSRCERYVLPFSSHTISQCLMRPMQSSSKSVTYSAQLASMHSDTVRTPSTHRVHLSNTKKSRHCAVVEVIQPVR